MRAVHQPRQINASPFPRPLFQGVVQWLIGGEIGWVCSFWENPVRWGRR
jgi:hypothetical protein